MRKLSTIAAALILGSSAMAQQALFGGGEIKSPEINPDHTVTFRIQAPKAVKVQVSGDFLPETLIDTPQGKWAVSIPADLKEGNDAMLKYMDEHSYPYEYRETEGGHIWRNWRTYFIEFAQKVFK